MEAETICKAIVDGFTYPIVFVDLEHIVRYMNRAAVYHYCTERGHPDLVGRSLFDCHFNPLSRECIERTVQGFKRDAKEIYLKVNGRNLRVYITPVISDEGKLIGYYERFEMNVHSNSGDI